jgi:glycosyltransferase involved in cell wall biosynthesis
MDNNKTIIVPVADFVGWGGGFDFIKFYISILDSIASEDSSVKIILTISIQTTGGRIIRFIKNVIKQILGRQVSKNLMPARSLVAEFSQFKHVEIVLMEKIFFYTYLKQFNTYLIFPTISPLKNIPNKNNIGYIPDLQHIHLPYLFSVKECEFRDISFKTLLSSCNHIFVNSEDTKKDIYQTYPIESANCNIFAMPFIPFSNEEDLMLNEKNVDISKYDLSEKFFIISNQFWTHKDHPTAFKAFAELVKLFHDIQIVCTGNTVDYRNPYYFKEIQDLLVFLNIQNRVKILGYIPKQEQIVILKKAIAVIQPTLFEGGRGGGSTYDAISHGVPVILSDIPINKEIQHENVLYFKTGDFLDMKDKMVRIIQKKHKRADNNKLIIQNKVNFNRAKQELKLFLENSYPQ